MKFILSGDVFKPVLPTPIDVIDNLTKEQIKQQTHEILLTTLQAIGEFTVDIIGAVTLIGSGMCILFKVAGWDDGYKWAGVLFTANILIKYLFGG